MRNELRVIRLEELAPRGCATCERWGPAVHEMVRVDADGRETSVSVARPDRCPACGRDVPVTLRRRILLVRVAGVGELIAS